MKEPASPGRGRENEELVLAGPVGNEASGKACEWVCGLCGSASGWMDGWMDLRPDKQSGTTR